MIAALRSRWRIFTALGVAAAASAVDHGLSDEHATVAARFHDRVFKIDSITSPDLIAVRAPDGARFDVRLCGVAPPGDRTTAAPPLDRFVGARVRLLLDERHPTRDASGAWVAYAWLEDGSREMLNEIVIRDGLSRADSQNAYAYRVRFETCDARSRRQPNRDR